MDVPTAAPAAVEVFFDPMCPYAYQTSRWLRSVREQTGLELRWRFFSLEEVNREEGKKHPWEREWSYGWSQMRIGALLRRRSQDDVDRWYEAVGRAFHEQGRTTHVPDDHRALLAELGYDPGLVDEAIADPTTTDEVRADHDFALWHLGGFGVATIRFLDGLGDDHDRVVFGPVVVPAPTGPDALRLWDLTVGFASFPHLYELRTPKRGEDLRHIGTSFEPYLRARAWRTIENPAP